MRIIQLNLIDLLQYVGRFDETKPNYDVKVEKTFEHMFFIIL